MGTVREYCRHVNGHSHESEHYQAAAHSRKEIIVSLRMAASVEAPLSPMSLSRILRWKMGGGSGERAGGCQQAAADTQAGNCGAAAHLSEVTALPLSPSHSLVMPSAV